MPPQASQGGADRISEHVGGIAGGVRLDFWANPFKQERPEDQVSGYFRWLWRGVVRSQPQAAMQP